MTQDIALSGQVAVVTGGSRGIGRHIAQRFAAAGASVAVTARTREQLNETVRLIEAEGGTCAPFVMDVTDAAQVNSGMDAIRDQFGPIDLLVNNAGIGGEGTPVWEVDPEAWWRIIEVNLRGAFLCARAVLPAMVERGQGRIINVGSKAGLNASPQSSAYSVSKAALLRLGENLAVEAGEHGVRVFTISPGLVLTEMTREMKRTTDLPPDAWMPVEKAGDLCLVLASGQADALNGRFIHARDDDIHDLIARAADVTEHDLNAMRLRR